MKSRVPYEDYDVDDCISGLMNRREDKDLIVLSINFGYYSDYPRTAEAGRQIITQLVATNPKPDVICVQDGLEGVNVFEFVGYRLIVSSKTKARVLADATYGSKGAILGVAEANLERLVVNEIYLRVDGNAWEAVDSGVLQISSEQMLEKEGETADCAFWPLAPRTVVWTKLRRAGAREPSVDLLCTRLTGGTFEDQFFVRQLARERGQQVERIAKLRSGSGSDLVLVTAHLGGVLTEDAPLSVVKSRVLALADSDSQAEYDRIREALSPEEMERRYRAYASAPLTAFRKCNWSVARCGDSGDSPYVVTNKDAHMQMLPTPLTSWKLGATRVGKLAVSVGNASQGNSPAPRETGAVIGRSASLHAEHRSLLREHKDEKDASERLQALLTTEMRELRDDCNEKGQAIGHLSYRLSETAEVVTSELRASASLRLELEEELAMEEAKHKELEERLGIDEHEAALKVKAAEQQLLAMTSVRGSLEAQIKTSLQIQAELQDHIDAERSGRRELEVAGERELNTCRDASAKLHGEVQERLEVERSEVDTWRTTTAQELKRLKTESDQQLKEEAALVEQLASLREATSRDRGKLRTEAALWSREVDALRARVEEADEECRQGAALAHRLNDEKVACASEKAALEEELRDLLEANQAGTGELQRVERETRDLREELQQIKAAIEAAEQDSDEHDLKYERDNLVAEIEAVAREKALLEYEIELAARRGILGCLRRRPMPELKEPAPLPPPKTPPPASVRRTPKPPQSSSAITPTKAKITPTTASPAKSTSTSSRSQASPDGVQSSPAPPPPRRSQQPRTEAAANGLKKAQAPPPPRRSQNARPEAEEESESEATSSEDDSRTDSSHLEAPRGGKRGYPGHVAVTVR